MICLKEKAWMQITEDFNSRHRVTPRSEKQLTALWKNLKARVKTDVANLRRSQVKTGGGLADASVDPMTEKICSMLPQQIQSLSNMYDDDAAFHCDTQEYDEDTEEQHPSDGAYRESRSQKTPSQPSSSVSRPTVTTETAASSSLKRVTASQSLSEKNKNRSLVQSNRNSCKEKIPEMSEKEQKRKMEIMEAEHKLTMELMLKEEQRKNELFKVKLEILSLKKKKLRKKVDECKNEQNKNLWQPF